MTKRKRRTEEEMIADLEAEIKSIKTRAAEEKAKASPDGKAFLAAVRALDKAIEAVEDPDLSRALESARAPLSAEMVKQGLRMPDRAGSKSILIPPGPARRSGTAKRVRRSTEDLERLRGEVLVAVQRDPGKRLGEIAKALGIETKDARRPAFDLVGGGELRTEGERGGTRYFPA